MPAKKRNGNGNSSGIGSMSAKQLKRKKPINTDAMVDIKPLTKNQERFFEAYENGKNIFAYGAAGTGKTFVALYLALRDVLNEITPYEKVYVVCCSSLENWQISTWLCKRCCREHLQFAFKVQLHAQKVYLVVI